MNKKLVTLFSLLILASLALAACGPSAPEVASLKIGEVHPFTGPLAEFGEPEHNSALLAAKHLEEAGYKIETVFGDKPHETHAILDDLLDDALGQAVFEGQVIEIDRVGG